MKSPPWLTLVFALLSIPMCNGEAIPDNNDRLYFSISSYVGEVSKPRVTPSPVVPHQDQAVPPRVTPHPTPSVTPPKATPQPAPLNLTLVEQQKLGLVPISGIQVDRVTPDLLQKVIGKCVKLRDWYDAFSKTIGSNYAFASDGYIYSQTEKRGLHFYEANKFGKELANTYGVPVTATVGGIASTFACSETPFQAAKINLLLNNVEAQTFINQFINQTGGAIQRDVAPRIQRVVTAAGKTVNAQFYQPWDDSSVWVMINLVLGKALQNQNDPMIKMLIHQIDTGKLIVEHTGNDDKWGDGSKLNPNILGPGENRLGLIWMSVRDTLKNHYNLP